MLQRTRAVVDPPGTLNVTSLSTGLPGVYSWVTCEKLIAAEESASGFAFSSSCIMTSHLDASSAKALWQRGLQAHSLDIEVEHGALAWICGLVARRLSILPMSSMLCWMLR